VSAGKSHYAVGLLAMPIVVPILFILIVGSQAVSSPAAACVPTGASANGIGDTLLDTEQMQIAQQIVVAVRAFPATADQPHAAVIALATARQESGLRNLPYGDRDSLGVFQQRPSQGWGPSQQVMNVAHATTTFLQHLIRIPGWQTHRVTDVAADIQHPAQEYRGLYQQWVPLATSLTERLWPQAVPLSVTAGARCGQTGGSPAGAVVYPVPPAFIGTDQHNWGGTGSHWSRWHTGTDFSVPCGTPVLAATSGAVESDTSQSWAGTWLIKVITGPRSVATWYAHMQQLDVHDGQKVVAGKQLGQAGDRGNTTGCHLHFEVHLHNGTIYGPDNVDPSQWLAQNASRGNGALEG
jgi:murein DD-endopeptidase MepM/ murein hydrolase activator NlpD